MFIEEEKEILVEERSLKWYRNLGYNCNVGDIIKINTKDISRYSKEEISFKCDYCGAIKKQVAYRYFPKVKKGGENYKDCCSNCAYKKSREKFKAKTGYETIFHTPGYHEKLDLMMEEKYGDKKYLNTKDFKEKKDEKLKELNVTNFFQIKENQEKQKETVREKYGVDNVFQSEAIKEKIKQTNLEKYGVKNPMQNEDIMRKSLSTKVKKYGDEQVPYSKKQKYLAELFNGEMNYPMEYYWVDIFFKDDNIYLEYDGSGHKMGVILGTYTEEEFKKKETIRYHFLKEKGLKEIRIIDTKNNKFPKDEDLIKIKDFCFNRLKNCNDNWVIVNFDKNGIIKTKKEEFKLKDILK